MSLILSVDTSGRQGSVALARATPGEHEVDVLEIVPLAGGAFSAQLVPQIAALLQNHGYTKSAVDAFAVVTGPGSFTGLRVGLAAIKGLAEILRKPIVAVSLLEAFAHSGSARGRVLSALDAGRGDVYLGDYEVYVEAEAHCRMHSERLLSRAEFLAEISLPENKRAYATGMVVVTPEAGLVEMARSAGIRAELVEYPNIACITRLGWERLERGCIVQPEELDANYIRRSDAEIFSAPRPELSAAIRAAALGDVPALLALEREMTTSAHWTREHYVQRVQAGMVMLAEKSGRLCGFLCAQVAGEWEIENLVVSALFRRQGVARRLVHALIQSARDRGASTLLLEVRESNLPARQLYEKQGFEVTGRRPMYYRDPPEDALLYALRISGL